jgi:hypothetical protein
VPVVARAGPVEVLAVVSRVGAMTTWEYQVAPIPLHNEALMLNNFGQDGWELVTIQTNAQGGLIAFLKRPSQGSGGA